MFDILIKNLWIVASAAIFLCGLYFSFKLKFIHLNFKKMFRAIAEKTDKKNSISSFEALTMSLAGRIGVGSLAGIALAVYLGGPRSIILDLAHIFNCSSKYICRKCVGSNI